MKLLLFITSTIIRNETIAITSTIAVMYSSQHHMHIQNEALTEVQSWQCTTANNTYTFKMKLLLLHVQ